MDTIEPLLLTEAEAAKLCGVSFWTMRAWVQAGDVPSVEFPAPLTGRKLRRKLIDRRDVMAFIDRFKSGSKTQPAKHAAVVGTLDAAVAHAVDDAYWVGRPAD